MEAKHAQKFFDVSLRELAMLLKPIIFRNDKFLDTAWNHKRLIGLTAGFNSCGNECLQAVGVYGPKAVLSMMPLNGVSACSTLKDGVFVGQSWAESVVRMFNGARRLQRDVRVCVELHESYLRCVSNMFEIIADYIYGAVQNHTVKDCVQMLTPIDDPTRVVRVESNIMHSRLRRAGVGIPEKYSCVRVDFMEGDVILFRADNPDALGYGYGQTGMGVNREKMFTLDYFGRSREEMLRVGYGGRSQYIEAILDRHVLAEYLSMCPTEEVALCLYKDEESRHAVLKMPVFIKSCGFGVGNNAARWEWVAKLNPISVLAYADFYLRKSS